MKKNPILEEAHNWTFDNRENVLRSEKCGCCYCLSIFPPSEINEWWGNDENPQRSAACPVCEMGCSVIGSASGHKITKVFLRKMNRYWYAGHVWDEKPLIAVELE